MVSMSVSIVWSLLHVVFDFGPSPIQIVVIVNGAALVAALVIAALGKQTPEHLLIDADRAYRLRELLVSGLEFGEADADVSKDELSFRTVVVERANNASAGIDPLVVYPRSMPKRTPVLAALFVTLAVLVTLVASGWFDRPVPGVVSGGLLLEETARRLAERAPQSDELQDLADQIRRLGERMRNNELTAEEARRQIDLLGRSIEEQMANLDRTLPFENREDAVIPPETEDAVRRALRSGMSENDVTELFTRMRSEGSTIPEIIDALEYGNPNAEPNLNLDIDDERMRDLMDQLNATTDDAAMADARQELDQARRSLGSSAGDLSDFFEGDDSQTGGGGSLSMAEEGGGGRGDSGGNGGSSSGGSEEAEDTGGQMAGDQAVEDTMADDYQYASGNRGTLREITGTVTDETIMDIITRELPSEATSELTEQEREIEFERVVEEAVGREDTPPDLQRLVRNYFLRVTMASEEGATDEQ